MTLVLSLEPALPQPFDLVLGVKPQYVNPHSAHGDRIWSKRSVAYAKKMVYAPGNATVESEAKLQGKIKTRA
jgi:hypothetical protein